MAKIPGFDIIGDIAVVEFREGLKGAGEREIAMAIKERHPHIKTILKKASSRRGEFRLRDLKVILGGETETTHREHGYSLRMDVKRVYFSSRESTERQRIADQVKSGENVMVMFAGIGPYAIAIAKKQPKTKVIAIESNPKAVDYMKDNIRINKLGDKIVPVLGDVKTEVRKYYGKCNRVVMPLPKEGYMYLPLAIKCLKPGGMLHFYYISQERDLFNGAVEIVRKECGKLKRNVRVLRKRKVLPYGPRIWKICLDAKVY